MANEQRVNFISGLILHNLAFGLAIVEERYDDATRLKADLDAWLDTLPSTPVFMDYDSIVWDHPNDDE